MEQNSIYQDISERTGGDIYIGIVGPVRSGKSTLIKRFMDTLILPNIENPAMRARAKDEQPQSAAGRTIMTTEPKFIPESAVNIEMANGGRFSCRLVDACKILGLNAKTQCLQGFSGLVLCFLCCVMTHKGGNQHEYCSFTRN